MAGFTGTQADINRRKAIIYAMPDPVARAKAMSVLQAHIAGNRAHQSGGGGLFGGGLGSILKVAAPIALSFLAPGLGTAIGSALGAGAAWAPAIGGAAIGAGTGALSGGGLKGIGLGAALGGAGGYLSSTGGLPGLGNMGGKTFGPATWQQTINAGGTNAALGSLGSSGILGSLGGAGRSLTGGLGNILGGGGSSSGGSFGGLGGIGGLGNIVSGALSYGQAGDAEDKLLAAQKAAGRQLSPYNATGLQANQMLNSDLRSGALGGTFNPGDLTADEGYQFRLQQGQQALERSMAARGLGESGAALKAAQDYGQGLAAQTYNDAYQQWLQQQQQRYGMLSGQSGQGLQAAGGLADIAGNVGNIQANAGVARSNIIGGTLSSILGGGNWMNAAGQQQQGNGTRAIRDANGNIIGYI